MAVRVGVAGGRVVAARGNVEVGGAGGCVGGIPGLVPVVTP